MHDSSSTSKLITQLKNDDIKALERLYKMYYSKLFSFCEKFDLVCMQPDDFVQQTFLKVWKNRAQLKEDVLFDKQIFVICRNLILNQLKRDKKLVYCEDETQFLVENPQENFQESVRVNLEKLNRVILMLPKKRKEVFLLHKIENLTYDEIAEFSNISKKTIANHIYLATLFIKEKLKKI
ncbi:sigma-70 family RNA polymerase sigma factor [Arenibacter palladensis]|uniref:RNA polymerase sigma factor n=1 Tax=Arenibacter palladensis TaxID=237373 RepID=UPI002FD346F9